MKILPAVLRRLDNIIITFKFIATKVGREYGINRLQKLRLVRRIKKKSPQNQIFNNLATTCLIG